MIGEAFTRELAGGEVDADAYGGVERVFIAPFLNLAARFTNSPVADGQNQPAFFG